MASIKLKHTSGNGTILHSPAANPSSDITLKLPSTTGSAGQVLKVASANHSSTNAELEFGAVTDTNDFVKLQAAASSSGVSALVFQNLDVTTYRTFKIVFSGYPVNDDAALYLRVLDGSTYKTGANTYNWTQTGTNAQGNAANSASSDSYAKVADSAGNNNYEGWRTEITYVPQVSGDPTYQNNFGFAFTNRYNSTNSHRGETFHFKFHQSDVTDGIEIYASSGNIAAYSYTLYGLKR